MAEPLTPYHLQRDGLVAVVADGPELLCYNANDDKPTWKQFCDNILVGVGATSQHVIAGDVDGLVTYYRVFDGQVTDTVALDIPAGLFALSPDGVVAMAGPDGVVLAALGQVPRPIGFAGATAMGFGPDANSMGIGVGASFHAVDANSGGAWGTQDLGAEVSGVAWSALGNWIVSAGNSVFVISGDGTELLHRIDYEAAVRGVVCNLNGVVAAAVHGANEVAVIELQNNRAAGFVHFRRALGQLCFGARATLGIGLDDGDANRVELLTRKAHRTEPHAGRGRNNWNLDVKIEDAWLRGAMSWAQAGGSPIAEFVPIPDDEGGSGLMWGCFGCLFMSLSCCTCSGMIYGLRAFGFF